MKSKQSFEYGIFESPLLRNSDDLFIHAEEENQKTATRFIKNLFVTSLLLFASYNLFLNEYSLAILETITAVMMLGTWRLVASDKIKIGTFTTLCMSLLIVLVSFTLLSGGVDHTGYIWVFTVPLLAVLFQGIRGFFWIAAFLLINITALLWMGMHDIQLPYSLPVLIQALLSFLLSTMLAYSFEFLRIRYQVSEEFGLNRFKVLIENSSDVTSIIDSLTTILFVSPTFERLTGYTSEEVSGTKAIMLVHPDDRIEVITAIGKAYLDPDSNPVTVRHRYQCKDGSWIHAETIGRFITGNKGQRYAILNSRDISEHVKFEEHHRHNQKMQSLGTLIGGIAHNINNILSAVVGNAFLLKSVVQSSESGALRVENIERLSMRASDMISQLLSYAHEHPVQMQNISLQEVCQQSAEFVRGIIPANIHVHISLGELKLPIQGDASLIHQVLVHLFTNARDALTHTKNPEIRFELSNVALDQDFCKLHKVSHAHLWALISISDNGQGIAPENLNRIFDPFFTTKDVDQGDGLGLSMVQGTVKTHGGIITVNSSENEGSTFNIYLPIKDYKTEEDLPSLSVAGLNLAEHSGLVLIVDDSEELLEVLEMSLLSLGYQVLKAHNGLEAISLFKDHSNDIGLVLMDIIMPQMSGVESAQEIRAINPNIQIIFLTGYDESDLSMYDLAHDASILHKPIDIRKLDNEIAYVLNQDDSNAKKK